MPSSTGEILLGENKYPLKIKNFSSSKSIKLRVTDNTILLTKPNNVSQAKALAFLDNNKDWLLAKLQEKTESFLDYLKDIEYLTLNKIPYKLILLQDDKKPTCIINHSKAEILLTFNDETELKDIILSMSKKILVDRAKATAQSFDIDLKRVSVRSQRTLWGSRSTSGTLSLNWRILLLPESLQNYIICHELAHIRFMDHSTSFWIYLNTLCPNAKKLDRELGKASKRVFSLR